MSAFEIVIRFFDREMSAEPFTVEAASRDEAKEIAYERLATEYLPNSWEWIEIDGVRA